MQRSDKIFIGLFVLVILFIVYGCIKEDKQRAEYRQRCEASGGVAFQPRYDEVCLKKDQVQDMAQ